MVGGRGRLQEQGTDGSGQDREGPLKGRVGLGQGRTGLGQGLRYVECRRGFGPLWLSGAPW